MEDLPSKKNNGHTQDSRQHCLTGLYFGKEDYKNLIEHSPRLENIRIRNPVVYSFEYGSHYSEGAAAFYSAYIMTVEFNAVVYEPLGRQIMKANDILNAAMLLNEMATEQ